MRDPTCQAGFSLIELIVVVVILGVLAGGAGMLILTPIEAYDDQVRRQQLVDQGEMALRQIARDVRRALPNSLRTTTFGVSSSAVEMVNTVDGARYRDEYGGIYTADTDFLLDFSGVDSSFNLLGTLNNPAQFNAGNRVAIYTTSTNIYAEALGVDDQGIITNAATVIGFASLNAPGPNQEDQISLVPPFRFTEESPGQRVFFVDGPISYVCDPGAGTLVRYSGYGFVDPQPTPPGSGAATVITQLSACNMSYQPGTAQRGGILTLEITIADSGEDIDLFHQIHVINVP